MPKEKNNDDVCLRTRSILTFLQDYVNGKSYLIMLALKLVIGDGIKIRNSKNKNGKFLLVLCSIRLGTTKISKC